MENEDEKMETWTVMSYNILCDKYTNPQQHGYAPSWVLAWDRRRQAILAEILEVNADLICLQVFFFNNVISNHSNHCGNGRKWKLHNLRIISYSI